MKRKIFMKRLLPFAIAAIVGAPGVVSAGATVDLELALLIDVSGSVSDTEFNLQRQGYVDAFNDAAIWAAIDAGAFGSIAVRADYWSGSGQQSQAVDWTLLDSQAAAMTFATALGGAGRPFNSLTAPGSAIAYVDPLFDNNGWQGTRNVIDVSGDGSQNSGVSTSGARDAFLNGGGSAINGITIGGGALAQNPDFVGQTVFQWYGANVQGGVGSFTLNATSFSDFQGVIDDKLIREITNPVPVPAAVWLFGSGLVALVGVSRRKATLGLKA